MLCRALNKHLTAKSIFTVVSKSSKRVKPNSTRYKSKISFSFTTKLDYNNKQSFHTTTMSKVKIYTKTGDSGTSSLFTGERRKKNDMIFDALGTVDELNANIGVAYEYAVQNGHNKLSQQLAEIQSRLLDLGSHIATPKSSEVSSEKHIMRAAFDSEPLLAEMEAWIDEMDEALPPLRNFILPSGGLCSAHLHVARAVCRRAERLIVDLVDHGDVDAGAFKYVNRMSDYFFMAARYAAKLEGKAEVIYSKPRPKSNPEAKEL